MHQGETINQVLSKAMGLNSWFWENLDGMDIPKGKKTRLAVACHDQVIEHQLSICTLVEHRLYGSAFALVRPIFEGFIRGVWLMNCASDLEVELYYMDKKLPEFGELVKRVETIEGFASGILGGVRQNSWSAMCSYTHSGVMQTSRRLTRNTIEPNYKAEEVVEILKFSGSFALLAFQQLAHIGNRLDLADRATKMAGATLAEQAEEKSGYANDFDLDSR